MGCKVKELRFGLHKCRTPARESLLVSGGFPAPRAGAAQADHTLERRLQRKAGGNEGNLTSMGGHPP